MTIQYLSLIFIIGIIPNAFAYTFENAELVVTNIYLEPQNPQAGQNVTIFANVYNGGIRDTKYFASVVTGAFFIDDEIRKIIELPNVEPGESNKITISSGPLWDAEWGKHKIEVIVDYHDTLPNGVDNPANNKMEKTFTIEPIKKTEIILNISPAYVIPNKDALLKITGSLLEKDSGNPLAKQKLTFSIGDSKISAETGQDGTFSFTHLQFFEQEKIPIIASFEGKFPLEPVNQTSYVYVLPSSVKSSAMIFKVIDPQGKYDFSNLVSDIVLYRDSYDKIFLKTRVGENTLLDKNTVWISLEENHAYLAEIYIEGRFFFSSNWNNVASKNVIEKTFLMPEEAQLRFRVTDSTGNLVPDVDVKNWIYKEKTNEEGMTPWIITLPTRSKNEPYVAEVIMPDGQIIRSEPFFVDSGEKKIIDIKIAAAKPQVPQKKEYDLPSWLKNNAKLWSHDNISTNEFAKVIRYLIKEEIITVTGNQLTTESSQVTIPSWIKNNARWWSTGEISDSDFVSALQHLTKIGIIRIDP